MAATACIRFRRRLRPRATIAGLAPFNHTHILSANVVWDIPIGRGHAVGGNLNTLTNAFIGGWEFSGIYLYSSGDPLTFGVPGATLGNGWGTRPNLVGDPNVSNPGANLWFNPTPFWRRRIFSSATLASGLWMDRVRMWPISP